MQLTIESLVAQLLERTDNLNREVGEINARQTIILNRLEGHIKSQEEINVELKSMADHLDTLNEEHGIIVQRMDKMESRQGVTETFQQDWTERWNTIKKVALVGGGLVTFLSAITTILVAVHVI